MNVVPESHMDLLERPLFAHLATRRADGWPQVNPMWFAWDGTHLKLTGTTIRYKHKNITRDPKVALSINDPDEPYRYLEVRGTVTGIQEITPGRSSPRSPAATTCDSMARPAMSPTASCT